MNAESFARAFFDQSVEDMVQTVVEDPSTLIPLQVAFRGFLCDRDMLVAALKGCLWAMSAQEKRMSGEFHLSSQAFVPLWEQAVREGRAALESAGAQATPESTKAVTS